MMNSKPAGTLRALLMGTAIVLILSGSALAQGNSGDAPGHSGDAPGHSGDAPGHSGDAPGNSGGAAGHGDDGQGGNGFGRSDNGPGKSDSAGRSDAVGKSEGNGKSEGKGKSSAARDDKPNLRAELAGLNSIQRNINGLMNSSDRRLDLLQEYIVQRAEYEVALAELEAAQDNLVVSQAGYAELVAELGVDGYPDATPDGLQAALTDLLDNEPAADSEEYAAWEAEVAALEAAIPVLAASDEFAALTAAQDAVDAAEAEVAEQEDGATDDDLMASLLSAANRNRVDTYDDEDRAEILTWAKGVLGIGEAEGALDDFMAP